MCRVQLEGLQENTFIFFAYIWKEKDGKTINWLGEIKSSQKRRCEKEWMGRGNKLLQKEEGKEWIERDESGKARGYGDRTSKRWWHAKDCPVFRQLLCLPRSGGAIRYPKEPTTHPQCALSGSHAPELVRCRCTPHKLYPSQALDAGSFCMETATVPSVVAVCHRDSCSQLPA